jgi:hypothetical protein
MFSSASKEKVPASTTKQKPPLAVCLHRILERVMARAERFVCGRWWLARTLLVSVLFSILFSGGLDLFGVRGMRYTPGYFDKIESPLLDVARFRPHSGNDINLNFRLTVPLLLHFLHGQSHWALPALTMTAIAANILLAGLFAWRVTGGDRVCGLFLGLNVASTFAGSFGFIAFYDAIARAQLMLAMLPGISPLLRGALVFTAAFTDERALIASGLLLVQGVCPPDSPENLRKRFASPSFLSVLAAMVCYAAARIILMRWAELSSPTSSNGPGMFVRHMDFLHPVVWFSLEGGWLFVALACLAMFRGEQRKTLALFMMAIVGMLGFALMIGDVMRSACYVIPALLVAFSVVKENDSLPNLRFYSLLAFLISVLGGNYDVFLDQITWFKPLSVDLFARLAGHMYDVAWPFLHIGTQR